MKVLIVNTSELTGGAAVAANRLMNALGKSGVEAKMLVRDRQTADPRVLSLRGGWRQRARFLCERLLILLHLRMRRKDVFQVDTGYMGNNITRLPAFREADVVHLHWVNQGMLSLADLRHIVGSGKPVVWTMHDLWPATAVCHYARGCERFAEGCRQCPQMPPTWLLGDECRRVWRRKQRIYAKGRIRFVACSEWLGGEARRSELLKDHTVVNIPNAIDTAVFRPTDRTAARRRLGLPAEGRIILFVSQRVTDERKGIRYLIEALDRLPELQADTSVAILGGHADEVAERLRLPVHALGYVSDPAVIVDAYNAADVFVTPSLEDNLPNTIMEALACGIPCVGFRVGGIPEMIDHRQNGYVATVRDAADLALGIRWVLCEAQALVLRDAALQKVSRCYSEASVAERYTAVYREAGNDIPRNEERGARSENSFLGSDADKGA